jgi:hypothetical protein
MLLYSLSSKLTIAAIHMLSILTFVNCSFFADGVVDNQDYVCACSVGGLLT